jgi:hypothetical protein
MRAVLGNIRHSLALRFEENVQPGGHSGPIWINTLIRPTGRPADEDLIALLQHVPNLRWQLIVADGEAFFARSMEGFDMQALRLEDKVIWMGRFRIGDDIGCALLHFGINGRYR